VRAVVEAAGIRDILSKIYGSNNSVNVVKATYKALSELVSLNEMARRRDLTSHELRTRLMVRSREAQEAEESQETLV
jgi:small subunit ribosomal protein S5